MKQTGDLTSNGIEHNLACYSRWKVDFPEGADLPPSTSVLDYTEAINAYLVDAATGTLHAASRIWRDMKFDLGIDTTIASYGGPNYQVASNLIKNTRNKLNFNDQFTKCELTYMGNKTNAALQSIITFVDTEKTQKIMIFLRPYLLDLLCVENVRITF